MAKTQRGSSMNKPTSAAESAEETLDQIEQVVSDELARDNFVSHDEDPMLTFSQAGRLIGRSHTTISRWVADGLLRSFRDPTGLSRIRRSELTRFYSGTALAQTQPIASEADRP